MTQRELTQVYRGYIDCLNEQNWVNLGKFVQEDVHYNDVRIGLSGYREMLERDFRAIPDLYFNIELVIAKAAAGREPAAFRL